MMKRKPNQLPASLKEVDIKALLRKRGVYTQQRINQELKEQVKPLAKALVKSKHNKVVVPQRHAQFSNEEVQSYWEKQIHIVDVAEQHFEDKLRQFIGKIQKDFLAHLDQEIEAKKSLKHIKTKDFFDDNEDEYLAKAQLDFTPLLESVATLSGQHAMKMTGQDQVYLPFGYRNTIKKNVDKFATSLLDTDKQHLTDILINGLQDGKSVPEIRNQIETDFPDYTKMQAQRITRTEVLRTSNQASLDAYEQSGVVEGKQWLTAGASDECAQYEGQIETLSGSFFSSQNEFQDGDPPLHPNCRCVILPVLVDGKSYTPDNSKLRKHIAELEAQIDKRTKAYKELQKDRIDDEVYIKSLERHLGVDDD